jgi:hypothetical protein
MSKTNQRISDKPFPCLTEGGSNLFAQEDKGDEGGRRGRPGGPPDGRKPPDGQKNGFKLKKGTRTLIFWVFLLLFSISLFQYYSRNKGGEVTITYTEFMQQLQDGNIKSVTFMDKDIEGEFSNIPSSNSTSLSMILRF